MPSDDLDRSLSSLSLNSTDSQLEDDWDHSLIHGRGSTSVASQVELPIPDSAAAASQSSRPSSRNSIVFPGDGIPGRATHYNSSPTRNGTDILEVGDKKRTLSDLLRLHSEKGSNSDFSVEEAKRIADVLGQWINASSSPYEVEDDFFVRHSQDDITLNASGSFRRLSGLRAEHAGRPRGKSETINANSNANAGSRSSSVLGVATT